MCVCRKPLRRRMEAFVSEWNYKWRVEQTLQWSRRNRRGKEKKIPLSFLSFLFLGLASLSVCVCVFVYEKGKERNQNHPTLKLH